MTRDLSRTYAAVVKLHELLLGMLPRGWPWVDLLLERSETVTRLTKLDAQAAPPGTPPPFLGLDETGAVAAMNEEIRHMTRDLGDMWAGTHARFTREDETPQLVLFDAADQPQTRFALDPKLVADLVVTDPLFDAIDAAREATLAAQNAFDEQIRGFREWGFDQGTQTLSFVLANGEPLHGVGVVVGSWSSENESWMWGWGNESVTPEARAATAPIRDGAENAPGLAALRTRTFPCRLELAVNLAVIASSRIGGEAVFGGSHSGGALFIAAMP
jgi:hypothetical protein